VTDAVLRRPSPRLWAARLLVWAVVTAAVGALVVLVTAITAGATAAGLAGGVTAVLAAAAVLVLRGRYRSWGYLEREDDLVVRRGVLLHRLSVVPYGRMQFIDVTAGPVERFFGLATVQLHTAAAATDARIPGLPAAEASRLRDRLAVLGEARAAGL
jgi:membrane protein YdbS with pleckstrin-like domain